MQKKPHKLFLTNSTTVIKTEGKAFLIGEQMNFKDMHFMQKVKKSAMETGLPEVKLKRKVSYIQYSDIQNGTYEEATELDVNGAYWKIAYNLGYIPLDIYEEGLEVDKKCRLMALGGLATSKIVYEYNPRTDKYFKTDKIENPITRSYFFDIANTLDGIMKSIMEGVSKNIYFYWVDAFFMKDFLSEYVTEALLKKGLYCKYKLVDKIEAYNITNLTQRIDVHMKDGQVKPFFRKKKGSDKVMNLEFAAMIEQLIDDKILTI
jgi:hypothetical protein